jgi:hypothetical protein
VLDSAFPDRTYINTVRAIREGIAMGDDVVSGISFLGTPVGKDLRGLMRRAGVMFRLYELSEAGDLPFVAEFMPMPVGSWHWLELRSGQCHGYLVRTLDRDAFPDDTPNQQDMRHSNQDDLFDDPKIVKLPRLKIYTVWLCYGATKNGAPTHALWGMPSGREAGTWLARRDVLNAARAMVPTSEESKRPSVDPRQAMKLRDEVIQALEEEGKSDSEAGDE